VTASKRLWTVGLPVVFDEGRRATPDADETPVPPPPVAPPPPSGIDEPPARPWPQPRTDRPGAPPTAPTRKGPSRRAIIEWVAILAAAVLAAFVLRAFVVQPYFIPSASMEPTLMVNDKVLVNKLAYDFHPIHRGDVIVFKRPPHEYTANITDLIKRVIGLPGETISANGGVVDINGRPLKETWLPKGVTTANFGPIHIPAGEYFVMGDNRGDSEDSRDIGPISKSLIVGRAFLIVWPVSQIGTL
jgi:signal peptidase I